MTFSQQYLSEVAHITRVLNYDEIERCVSLLTETRAVGGRVFVLGVGGSAANASHAVNDLRKLAKIEAYAPTDNIAELTARTNDIGWSSVFDSWLETSHLSVKDLLFILSVGGGNVTTHVSQNLVFACRYAKNVGAKIIGIVGLSTGYTAEVADVCIVVPTINPEHVTQHAESFQAVLWHLFVSHPLLKVP